MTEGPLRVAIVSTGIGLVQRGFERYFRDLFDHLRGRDDISVTLLKGGGPPKQDERALRFLPRNGQVLRNIPLHRLIGRTPLHVECLTFAIAMLPDLIAGKYDVVHVIEPPLARLLFHMRRVLGLKFRLLYTEGCAMPPGDYPPADFTQHVSPVTEADAIAHGHDPAFMRTIPCGFDRSRFAIEASRAELRQMHGIGKDTFLVLSVAAINRGHKRTHHLIEEFAGLEGDAVLWLDGSLDHGDPDLLDHARDILGSRIRITHLPSHRVGELYRMADVMPHASLFESFGLSLVEAASCGLPVICHDNSHFRWLLPNPASWLDMSKPGALQARLKLFLHDENARANASLPPEATDRFRWKRLVPEYLELYRKIAS